jgi:hypothetical protein
MALLRGPPGSVDFSALERDCLVDVASVIQRKMTSCSEPDAFEATKLAPAQNGPPWKNVTPAYRWNKVLCQWVHRCGISARNP